VSRTLLAIADEVITCRDAAIYGGEATLRVIHYQGFPTPAQPDVRCASSNDQKDYAAKLVATGH
jgi:hypothetical protein